MVLKVLVEVAALDAGNDAVKEVTGNPSQRPFGRESERPNP